MLSRSRKVMSRPVPFIPRDGTGRDGIGTGFSKMDGILPTLDTHLETLKSYVGTCVFFRHPLKFDLPIHWFGARGWGVVVNYCCSYCAKGLIVYQIDSEKD